jgi:hypothetical protein
MLSANEQIINFFILYSADGSGRHSVEFPTCTKPWTLGATVMKPLLLLIFYCLTLTAFGQTLNDSILQVQKEAIRTSPYTDAKSFAISKYQTQFRLTKFPKAISNLLFDKAKLVDTLWIAESFDEMCPDCPSFASEILYKDTLYHYNKWSDNSNSKIEFTTKLFNKNLTDYDYIISEVVDSVRQKHNWLANPLRYGSNLCADGDHTLVTIIYPDRQIESLYVRCWMQTDQRTAQ